VWWGRPICMVLGAVGLNTLLEFLGHHLRQVGRRVVCRHLTVTVTIDHH